MLAFEDIAMLDLLFGSIATIGLLYLLYAETLVVHYDRFFRLITLGLFIYASTGPIIGYLAPAYIHLIHATAALFITLGLWDLVTEDLRGEEDFEAIIAPAIASDEEFGFEEAEPGTDD